MKGLRRSGFTMIELVIVIVIMGVMAFTAYKALMASSDKNKVGTLMKSEFGEIRQDCTDTLEQSKHHTFAEIGDKPFHKLFPKSYSITNVDGNESYTPLGADDEDNSTKVKIFQNTLLDSNKSTFVSDIVTECVWTIEDKTTFGNATNAPKSTYSVSLACSSVADKTMRKLIESKALKYVQKEYDIYNTLPTAGDDGNITFSGLIR
jgi:prepilin-type N-terminal cleavage/methylation domain-containing protein